MGTPRPCRRSYSSPTFQAQHTNGSLPQGGQAVPEHRRAPVLCDRSFHVPVDFRSQVEPERMGKQLLYLRLAPRTVGNPERFRTLVWNGLSELKSKQGSGYMARAGEKGEREEEKG